MVSCLGLKYQECSCSTSSRKSYFLRWKITIAVKANLEFSMMTIIVLKEYRINLDKLYLSPVFNQFMNCMSSLSPEKHKSLTSVCAHCSQVIILKSCSCQFWKKNEIFLNGKGARFHKILFFGCRFKKGMKKLWRIQNI